MNYMKTITKETPNFKVKLAGGFLACKLQGIGVRKGKVGKVPGGLVERFYHLGLQYFSPYESTLMMVREVEDPGECAANEERVYLASTGEFFCFYVGLAPFADCAQISAQFFELEDCARAIPKFLPQPVPALRLTGCSDMQRFFPRRVAVRGRRAGGDPAPAAGGGEAAGAPVLALEDGSVASDVSSEEDAPDCGYEGLLYPLAEAYEAH